MNKRRKLLLIPALLIVVFLLVGTYSYHILEGWDYLDSLYFSTVTLTTIGYGDLYPTNNSSKLFTVFFILSGVGIFLFALTVISFNLEKNRIKRKK